VSCLCKAHLCGLGLACLAVAQHRQRDLGKGVHQKGIARTGDAAMLPYPDVTDFDFQPGSDFVCAAGIYDGRMFHGF